MDDYDAGINKNKSKLNNKNDTDNLKNVSNLNNLNNNKIDISTQTQHQMKENVTEKNMSVNKNKYENDNENDNKSEFKNENKNEKNVPTEYRKKLKNFISDSSLPAPSTISYSTTEKYGKGKNVAYSDSLTFEK